MTERTDEIASLCEHGSMACPDCDGVDDCPHEQGDGE